MNQSRAVDDSSTIEKLKIQKGVICFYAYYAVMTLTKAMGIDSSNSVYNLLFGLGCLIMLYKLFATDYSITEIVEVVLFVSIGFICTVISGEKTIVLLAITIAGLKYCDFRQAVKVAYYIRLVTTSLFIILSFLGVFNAGLDDLITTSFTWVEVYDFGYSTPNNAFINVFLIIIMYMYLNYEHLNYKHVIVTSAITIIFYKWTNSRTGAILLFATWFLIFLDKYTFKRKFRRFLYTLLAISPILCGVFSWLATVMYRGSGSYWWQFVNRIFSGRLNITQKYYNVLGISLLPRKSAIMDSYNHFGFLDNMYMNTFFNDGIAVGAILLVLVCISNYRLYKAKYYKELILISVFAVYAMLEEFPLNPIVNPFIMLIGLLIYNEFTISGKKIPKSNTKVRNILRWGRKSSVGKEEA